MEKSSDLIMKFGYFGRYLKEHYSKQHDFTDSPWRHISGWNGNFILGFWTGSKGWTE